jgi:hypothetical protein
MDVERDRDGVEEHLRHDLPVRSDDERVGPERAQLAGEGPQLLRGERADPARLGDAFQRRRDELVAAPGRTVRLRDDGDDLVPLGEPLERRDGELARPEDDQLQRAPEATASTSSTSSSVAAGRTFFALSM